MNYEAEYERIKNFIANLSEKEFDDVLYDCGIELIKPSIESVYVKSLKKNLTQYEYRKEVCQYSIKEEFFNVDITEKEVA